MDNIVIGQYIKTNSWLHKLDPRTKLISLILLLVSVFLINDLKLMTLFLLLIIIITLSAKIPLIKMINGLKPILFLMTITFFFHVTSGDNLLFKTKLNISIYTILLMILLTIIYFKIKKYIKFKITLFFIYLILLFVVMIYLDKSTFKYFNFKIYKEGLNSFLFIFLRIINVISLTTLLTFTTMPMELNNALEYLLRPLKILKINSGTIAISFSLVLRSIPLLFQETTRIRNAQASRGLDFNESNIKQKINQIIALLIPLFVISLRSAEDLANAMEVRGYIIGAKRTRLEILKFRVIDYIILTLTTFLLIGLIIW